MSIFGTMKTAVSGMNAQGNRLGAVGDNIANSSTTGYKRASTTFSSLVLPSTSGSYTSGGVQANIRYSISEQGALSYTTSGTDLAIQGDGFFIVQDAAGSPFLTRAGSFVPNANGNLENSAGFLLMGYPYGSTPPAAVVNGFAQLEAININDFGLTTTPTTAGSFPVNLNRDASVVPAANLPSANSASAQYTHKASIAAFDSGGSKVLYDIYYTKVSGGSAAVPATPGPPATPAVPATPAQWEVSIYRQDQSTNGGFPYSATGRVQTKNLTFDPVTNKLSNPADGVLSIVDSNGLVPQTITLDMSETTQVSKDFTPGKALLNGNGPSEITDVEVGKDGLVTAVYKDGGRRNIYQIALATVPSIDKLTPINGNVYSPSNESGVVTIGFPESGSYGYIQSGALENSNVDIANELTEMIESQRIYTANSKVFQTGSDIMDVLINLKR